MENLNKLIYFLKFMCVANIIITILGFCNLIPIEFSLIMMLLNLTIVFLGITYLGFKALE